MRKWITGISIGALLAIATVAGSSAYFSGGWPETCLEMNDMVEASAQGSGAVGIYQRAFGDRAEVACQRDHLEDVRRAFAWAIDDNGTASGHPTVVLSRNLQAVGATPEEYIREAGFVEGQIVIGGIGSETLPEHIYIPGGRYVVDAFWQRYTCLTAALVNNEISEEHYRRQVLVDDCDSQGYAAASGTYVVPISFGSYAYDGGEYQLVVVTTNNDADSNWGIVLSPVAG